MRAVIDHHVDRLGVEVQQCMKLTNTNDSIGFIQFNALCAALRHAAKHNIGALRSVVPEHLRCA